MADEIVKGSEADDAAIITEFEERLDEAKGFCEPIHNDFKKHKRFACKIGGQWSQEEKDRMGPGNPHLEVNRLMAYVNQVVNSIIQSDIGCDVSPRSLGAADVLARVRKSQLMTLAGMSHAPAIFGNAFRECVWGGFGVIREKIIFADSKGFNKTFVWDWIQDPTCFYWDPSAKGPALKDMAYCILEYSLSKTGYEREYGRWNGAKSKTGKRDLWESGQKKKVYEYWRIVDNEYNEYSDMNGVSITEDDPAFATKVKRDKRNKPIARRQTKAVVEQYLIADGEIKSYSEWPAERIPFQVIEGLKILLDDEVELQPMTARAEAPQKYLNFIKSQKAILASKAPIEIVFVPVEGDVDAQVGRLAEVAQNGAQDVRVVKYRSLDKNGNAISPPTFKAPMLGDPVLTTEEQMAIADIEACFGMMRNSWLSKPADASGVAIRESEDQGMTSNFDFVHNLYVAIEESYRQALEVLPKLGISMQIKLAGEDEQEETVWINGGQDNKQYQNYTLDPNEEYSLSLNVGPSEKTILEQTFKQLVDFAKAFPSAQQAIGDLAALAGLNNMFKSQIAKRMKATIPPQILGTGGDPRLAQAQQIIQQLQGQLHQMQSQSEMFQTNSKMMIQNLKMQLQTAKQNKDNQAVADGLDAQIRQEEIRIAAFEAETDRLKAVLPILQNFLTPPEALTMTAPMQQAA